MARKITGTTKTAPTRKKTGTTRKENPSPALTARPQKPMFSAGTWITLLLLAALIGFAFYLNRGKEAGASEATPTNAELASVFTATDGVISSIEITPAGSAQSVRIVRNELNAWVIELPLEAEADQGLAEAAATQLSALQVINPLEGNPADFGFDKPVNIITVKFSGGKTYTLEVGDSTPTNSGYYVRVDGTKMMITSLSGIDALLQLVFFPPYLNTPTPTPLPATETPAPPTEAVTTPEAAVTPTP